MVKTNARPLSPMVMDFALEGKFEGWLMPILSKRSQPFQSQSWSQTFDRNQSAAKCTPLVGMGSDPTAQEPRPRAFAPLGRFSATKVTGIRKMFLVAALLRLRLSRRRRPRAPLRRPHGQ